MKATFALRELGGVTASQWGMVTAAQAASLGVSRLALARLADAGHLYRLTHGVYRDAGAPATSLDDLRAAWLAAEPAMLAEARLADGPDGIVVGGASAAFLHGIGDLGAGRHDFVSRRRRQSRRPEIRYRQRTLEPPDVTIVAGLPVMTIERTIADLVDDVGDLSLTADALRDASRGGPLDTGRLEHLLAPLAARAGLNAGDGAALLACLESAAGIDAAAVARRVASDREVGPLVTADFLGRLDAAGFARLAAEPGLERTVHDVSQQISRTIAAATKPSLDAAATAGELIARSLAERLLAPDFLGPLTEAIGQAVRSDVARERTAPAPRRATVGSRR